MSERVVEDHGTGRTILLDGLDFAGGIAYLVAGGCGAWVDRESCGVPAVAIVTGTRAAWFAYRSLCLEVTAVCARHLGDLTCDMPADLLRDQAEELEKFRAHVRAQDRAAGLN